MNRPTPLAAALVGLALAAIGCAPNMGQAKQQAPAAGVPDADVTVVARDVSYANPPSRIPSGTVKLALDNQGSARHDLTIENAAGRSKTVASASGGRSSAGTVTLAPGNYVVYCSVGGHRKAGMEFDVTVG